MKNSVEQYRDLLKDTLAFLKERDLIPAIVVHKPIKPELKKQIPEPIKSQPVQNSIKQQKPSIEKPVKPAVPSSQEEFLRKMVAKLIPDLVLTDQIPQKNEKMVSGKRKSCIILSFSSSEEELQFLKQLAKAIHTEYADTKILSGKTLLERKEKFSASQAQLFIAWEKDLSFFENSLSSSAEQKTLFSIPILLLSSPLDYAQDPKVKQQLWMQISQQLQ